MPALQIIAAIFYFLGEPHISQAIMYSMNDPLSFAKLIKKKNARGVILLAGDEKREEEVISKLSAFYKESIRIVSPQEGNVRGGVSWNQLDRVLGESHSLAIVSARVALDANALAASTGLIKAGGLLVVALGKRKGNVPSSQSMSYGPPSGFMNYVLSSLRDCEVSMGYDVEAGVIWKRFDWRGAGKVKRGFNPTIEQQMVVDKMGSMARREGGQVLVVRGNRGRGKSAALGLGLAAFLKGGGNAIIVSKTLESVGVLIHFFEKKSGNKFSFDEKRARGKGRTVYWFPLDMALNLPHSFVDVLVVDEAAEFPVDQLLLLVKKFKKLVFSTTVQGYEGSGRGFEKKFLEGLKGEAHHEVEVITINEPIRFLQGDPLEAWAFSKLYLSPVLDTPSTGSLEVRELGRGIDDIGPFYPILVEAHYRNEPNDLAALMDLPNRTLFGLLGGGKPLGFAEVAQEGPLDEGEEKTVLSGGELLGNLIPDKLLGRSGMQGIQLFPGKRVIRIAVHPAFQGRGFGSYLLSNVEGRAMKDGMGWVGASFSIEDAVIRFWLKNGYIPAYISWKRVSSGGFPSVIVIKPLKEEVRKVLESGADYVLWQWVSGLSTIYKSVEPRIMARLMISLGRLAPFGGIPYRRPLEIPPEAYPYLLLWAARLYASSPNPKLDYMASVLRFISEGNASKTDRFRIGTVLRELYASA